MNAPTVQCTTYSLYSSHPYIFFNRDKTAAGMVHYDSMTFIGFNIRQVGKVVNLVELNNQIIEGNIMTDGLYRWLRENRVDVQQFPERWSK